MKVIEGTVTAPPPCPTWFGRRVEWGPWQDAPTVFICPPPRSGCEECGHRGTWPDLAWGIPHPLPGETVKALRPRRTRSGRTYSREVEVSAIGTRDLMASRCVCGTITVVDVEDPDAGVTLICDGCDQTVAVGANDLEAVAALAAAGGHSERAGRASKDWCTDCVAATVAGSTDR